MTEVAAITMDDFPDELIVNMFSFVTDGLLLLDVLPLVCKRWHRLSFDERAWSNVRLGPDVSKVDSARMVLRAPHLGLLDLSDWWLNEADIRYGALRRSCVSVRELVGLTNANVKPIRDLMWRSRWCLRHIFFEDEEEEMFDSDSDSDEEGDDGEPRPGDILSMFSALKGLRFLKMVVYPYTLYSGELLGHHGLRTLQVAVGEDGLFTDELTQGLTDLLVHLVDGSRSSLRSISLGPPLLMPTTVVTSISQCSNLEYLEINLLNLEAVSGSSTIEWLSLYFNKLQGYLSDEEIDARCRSLQTCDTMRRLRVLDCLHINIWAVEPNNMLNTCSKPMSDLVLKVVSASRDVRDARLDILDRESLATILKRLPNLEELVLSQFSPGDVPILAGMRKLTRLRGCLQPYYNDKREPPLVDELEAVKVRQLRRCSATLATPTATSAAIARLSRLISLSVLQNRLSTLPECSRSLQNHPSGRFRRIFLAYGDW